MLFDFRGKTYINFRSRIWGVTAANLLQKNLPSLSAPVEHQISITDQKDYFMMGLVNLWILSGIRKLEDSKIALNRLKNKGINYLNGEVTAIDPVAKTVTIRESSILLSLLKTTVQRDNVKQSSVA